jgi:hypothetical protein
VKKCWAGGCESADEVVHDLERVIELYSTAEDGTRYSNDLKSPGSVSMDSVARLQEVMEFWIPIKSKMDVVACLVS